MQQASLKSLRTAWTARRKFSIILSMVMVLLTSAIMTSYLGLSHIVGLKSVSQLSFKKSPCIGYAILYLSAVWGCCQSIWFSLKQKQK